LNTLVLPAVLLIAGTGVRTDNDRHDYRTRVGSARHLGSGVTVSVASPNLQGIASFVTSENGDYIVGLLPPGVYT
jgi:hypothetical protein